MSPSTANSAPILLVSGDFVATGGMDQSNYALASHLLGLGREVHLVAHRVAPTLSARPGAVFHLVRKPLNSYVLSEPLLRRSGRYWARRLAPRGARVVVNGGNCDWGDVNWVHYVHAAWAPLPTGGFSRRIKSAYTHAAAIAAERKSLRRACVVIANSERTRTDLIGLLGLDPARVHTVYLGVDADRFRPPTAAERFDARARLGWSDDRPTVTFVGALGDRRKGLDTLLKAWRALESGGGWNARLAVVGAGAALARLKADAGAAGGAVEFLGFCADVHEVLRASDVLVSPVRYEPYGLNVQEALCCGLPALVSRSAGVAERYPPELLDLLIPDPEDSADLADRLRRWRDGRDRYAASVATLSAQLRATTWDESAAHFARVARLVR